MLLIGWHSNPTETSMPGIHPTVTLVLSFSRMCLIWSGVKIIVGFRPSPIGRKTSVSSSSIKFIEELFWVTSKWLDSFETLYYRFTNVTLFIRYNLHMIRMKWKRYSTIHCSYDTTYIRWAAHEKDTQRIHKNLIHTKRFLNKEIFQTNI
jgi:hypothetical protein